jgi:hypothetical protein
MQSTRYSCQTLTKLAISRQIVEKFSNIKFYENPSSGTLEDGLGNMSRNVGKDLPLLLLAA